MPRVIVLNREDEEREDEERANGNSGSVSRM